MRYKKTNYQCPGHIRQLTDLGYKLQHQFWIYIYDEQTSDCPRIVAAGSN